MNIGKLIERLSMYPPTMEFEVLTYDPDKHSKPDHHDYYEFSTDYLIEPYTYPQTGKTVLRLEY